MLHIHEYMKLKNSKIWEGHLSHNEKIWEEYEADWSGRYGSLVRLYRTGDGLSSGGARLDKFGSNDSNEDDDALWDLICFTKPFPKESHQKLSSQRINGFIQSRGMLAALFVTKTWLIWLLPQEQHITMEDASSLLVNSWTAMSVFLVQWSMFQTAPGSPFWIVLAQKLQFHYVSLALIPWYNWKNATKIIKTGNYVEPNSMFPFSASTAATFIYSVWG